YRSQRDRRFPQGLGLGLTIANDLVLAHGGRLVLESQPGAGSRFIICLPL
ncbi:MAG: ATP-binding protein, partial [Anaerolinea sp.]|nr:ATP-binding protein [Anaerolinea sp.]